MGTKQEVDKIETFFGTVPVIYYMGTKHMEFEKGIVGCTVPVIYYIGTKLEDLRQVILFCTVPVIYYIGTKR